MNILLSAYACVPNTGSEPGMGWNWALTLARKGHTVWVLTRSIYNEDIEKEKQMGSVPANVHFLYHDNEKWMPVREKIPYGYYLYYLIWQAGACRLAREAHARERFDLAHHVTWGSIRIPSFLGGLGIPFIAGPLAGGERAPLRLRMGYGRRQWLYDLLRDVSNMCVKYDPMMRRTFAQAARIYVTSPQTRSLVPRRFRRKTRVQLGIALDWNGAVPAESAFPPRKSETNDPCKILYVGTLVDWKGLYLGLPAFANLLKSRPNARMTVVGKGKDEQRLRRVARRLGLEDHVEWAGWIERGALPRLYRQHDVFLYPSVHDSGGWVVLEALSHGLPVVCLDLGGPARLVDDSCGMTIRTRGLSKDSVIRQITDALEKLAGDPALRDKLGQAGVARVRHFTWPALVDRIYDQDLMKLCNSHPSHQC